MLIRWQKRIKKVHWDNAQRPWLDQYKFSEKLIDIKKVDEFAGDLKDNDMSLNIPERTNNKNNNLLIAQESTISIFGENSDLVTDNITIT